MQSKLPSPLKVVFLSTAWDFNPYQTLLMESLKQRGFTVMSQLPRLIFAPTLLRQRPDVVHIQFLQYFLAARFPLYGFLKFILFIVQVLVLRLSGIPMVWTVHEWIDKVTENGSQNVSPFKAHLLGQTLSAAITHCESSNQMMVAELGLKNGNAQKVVTIPHANYIGAYPNEISSAEARKKLGLSAESMVFLYFGSIHRSKGVLEAIAAFKELNEPDAKLILAGKPSLALRAAILEAIGAYEQVYFVDPQKHIPDEQVQLYMNASDVVVLPYKTFTTSGVALLAMSFKKACIAPNAGFFKDVFNDSGAFLYESDESNGLQNAMSTAFSQRLNLDAMGQANFDIAKVWNWDYIADKTIGVYYAAIEDTLCVPSYD